MINVLLELWNLVFYTKISSRTGYLNILNINRIGNFVKSPIWYQLQNIHLRSNIPLHLSIRKTHRRIELSNEYKGYYNALYLSSVFTEIWFSF